MPAHPTNAVMRSPPAPCAILPPQRGAILHPQRYRERLLGALVVDSSKIRNTLGYIKLIAL